MSSHKLVVTYRRTRTLTDIGTAEVELTQAQLETLLQGKNMEAWTMFTLVHEVKEWQRQPKPGYRYEVGLKIDGVELVT